VSVIGFPTTLSTAHHSARAYPDAAAWLAERRAQDVVATYGQSADEFRRAEAHVSNLNAVTS
jgi:hypothetical protein